MIARLTHLRNVLDRLELLLEPRGDDSAGLLLCAVKALSREIAVVESAEPEPYPNDVRTLLEQGYALIERVKAYADAEALRWFHYETPAPSDDDTVILSSEHLFALIDRMPDGATTPPDLVAEVARESQLIGRYSTIPSPPPAPFAAETRPTGRADEEPSPQ
jgi:hypothetical protein